MAIGIYFRTAYEQIKTNFRNKKYDPIDAYNSIRADMCANPEFSNINPKDIVIGCLKFINEDLTDIESVNLQPKYKFVIFRDQHKCAIITEDVYVLMQNINSYDRCSVHFRLSPAEAEKDYYDEVRITAFIVDTIFTILASAYADYYLGRRKYNL